MRLYRNHTLVVFSDVNFSPQLFAILQELHNQKISFRVLLIGDPEVSIGLQIMAQEWNLRIIPKRNKLSSVLNLIIISAEIIRNRPKVLFASGQFATVIGMFTSKALNVPKRIFIRHHSNFHHKYNMKLGVILDKMANYSSTEIIAVSAVVKDILISNEAAKPEKVRLIYNGIDLRKFRNINLISTKAHDLHEKPEQLLHIGVISRLTELKGVEYIAQAFVKLQLEFPNSRLHIVGAISDSYTEIMNILAPLDRDIYTIERENSDIPGFFQNLDVFIHVPIGVEDEAFGIVYIEALATGVPCIFTKSGILNELNEKEKYVFIVPPRDFEAIYYNLRQIILGINTPRIGIPNLWINQFSLEKIAKNYVEIIKG